MKWGGTAHPALYFTGHPIRVFSCPVWVLAARYPGYQSLSIRINLIMPAQCGLFYGHTMDHCINCRWFRDAHYSRTYISPRCTVRGDDDCAYMRQYVCGVNEARLYQPRPETHEGTESNHGST